MDRRSRPTASRCRRVFTIVNEETRKQVEDPVTRALRDGVIVGLANHTVLISKDGTERPIADSAAPIRGDGDVVLGAVLVFRDVTEDRKAEIALKRSLAREQSWAERLRQVAAASLTINAATTQDSIVGVIDGEARRILGAGRCKVVFDRCCHRRRRGQPRGARWPRARAGPWGTSIAPTRRVVASTTTTAPC